VIVLCLMLAKFVISCFCGPLGFRYSIYILYIVDHVGKELPGTSFNNYGIGHAESWGFVHAFIAK
jgi:hypothetical protein